MRKVKFSYIFQHGETGRFQDQRYTLQDIEISFASNGTIPCAANDGWQLIVRRESTGLLDKNGREIYEGDILSTLGHTPEVGTVVTEVVWDEQEARFIEVETDGCRYSGIDNGVSEVIGNIYANPDLFTEPQP